MATPADYLAPQGGLSNAMPQFRRMFAMEDVIEVPAGTVYRLDCDALGGLGYRSGQTIVINGKLLMGTGWPSGYLIHSELLGGEFSLVDGLNLRFGPGGGIEYIDDAGTASRKGIGITNTQHFDLRRPDVKGDAGSENLFSMEFRSSKFGLVVGGSLSIHSLDQGSDGLHTTGGNSNIDFSGMVIDSGDDSVGITNEVSKFAGNISKRLRFLSCKLRSRAHSMTKILNEVSGGACTIEDMQFLNCEFTLFSSTQGMGAPHVWQNKNPASSIKSLLIDGGFTRTISPDNGTIHDAVFRIEGVTGAIIRNHDISHFTRSMIEGVNTTGLVVENVTCAPSRTIPRPSVPKPLVNLVNCPGAQISTAGLTPSYAGQLLLAA